MNKNLPFVFLPTNKYSRLIYLEGIKEYLVLVNDKLDIFEQGESYAFAYVLGDIKPDEVGVWAYCKYHLGSKGFQSKGKGFICGECRKIIATNDSSMVGTHGIDTPSLEILVELKKKGINETDVEYEEIWGKPYMAKGRGIEISPSEFLPKLKEGSIIIVKDGFDVPDRTDKELINMIKEKEVEDELAKEHARIYAELKKDFDMDDESYYNQRAIGIYKAFIQGWGTHKVLQGFSEQEIKDLKLVRNYFGEHDKTTFEHFAFAFLDGIIKKIEKK